MKNTQPHAVAAHWSPHNDLRRRVLMSVPLMVSALIVSGVMAFAEDTIIKSHGISTFGELKYPTDFTHLDYVNAEAPKGGEISTWTSGTFDSMNPYSRKGRSGALSSVSFESLLT
ncbi:MAG: hypothetical protein ABJQ14_09125, partial [Hyphomicrobiales bacterium]